MTTLISIDPGVSSAYAVLSYSDTQPAELLEYAQFKGGAEELVVQIEALVEKYPDATVICEDFTARKNDSFGYTTDSLEPLVCIGALMAMGVIDRRDRAQMRSPAAQYFVGGSSLAERKKNRRLWLADNGFQVMPKDVGQRDCDDVRSAISHGISYLRKFHKPTQEKYFKEL